MAMLQAVHNAFPAQIQEQEIRKGIDDFRRIRREQVIFFTPVDGTRARFPITFLGGRVVERGQPFLWHGCCWQQLGNCQLSESCRITRR